MKIQIRWLPQMYKSTYVDGLIRYELSKQLIANLRAERYDEMESYLRDRLNIKNPLTSILKKSVKSVKFMLMDNYYVGDIPQYITVDNSDYSLRDIVNLIDKGNLEIKGTNIYTKSIEYVEEVIPRRLVRQLW